LAVCRVLEGEFLWVPAFEWSPHFSQTLSVIDAIQKAVGTDPQAIPSVRGERHRGIYFHTLFVVIDHIFGILELDAETEAHIASYKDIIRSQAQELQQLHAQVNDLLEQASKPPPPPPAPAPTEVNQHVFLTQQKPNPTDGSCFAHLYSFVQPTSSPDPAPQIAQLQQRIDELEGDLAREQNSKREIEKEHEDLLVLLDELNMKRTRDKSKMKDAGVDVSEGSDDEGDEDDGDDD
jgi:hypothetical protein